MSYETILFKQDGGVATITLNRPASMNGINLDMIRDLNQALVSCSDDPTVRAVVLTGEGRAFCPGADMAALAASEGAERTLALSQLASALHEHVVVPMRWMPKPVIAAINGAAAGAGLGLALAADVRVAASNAVFTLAYLNVGFSPDCANSFFLPRLVGMAKAMEMYLFNERLSAEEAKQAGLLYKVVEAAELPGAASEIAGRLASVPTFAIGQTKHLYNQSFSNNLEAQLRAETQSVAICAATADHREGVDAFRAKRAPNFTGR